MTNQAVARRGDIHSSDRQLKLVGRPASVAEPDKPAESPADNTFEFSEDEPAAKNYTALAKRLAKHGDLFRGPRGGLLLLLPDGKHQAVTKAADLSPIIVDRVPVRVVKNGKITGNMISATHLAAMLRSQRFLTEFQPVDQITDRPLYLPGFHLTAPGYNDGGPGYRILYVGDEPVIADSLDAITVFLDVMDWESDADRTNAVAAALTVLLRNHWPGGKPILCATATKSHAGKDTVIAFATGVAKAISISYQATNWALERSFVGAIKTCPDAAVVVIENARLDTRNRFIASAIIERFATDPEPLLFSTGTGEPIRIRNDIVLAISTNFGKVSEDIMNRSLPIHLSPIGDVASRKSPIGNPKLEFLPANRDRIAAELRRMVERWKAAGSPLDQDVQYPFSQWAKTIGGILKVSGFADFLANYGTRKTADDPIRRGLGLLGVAAPHEWRRPDEWAELAVELGLVKTVIPEHDRENDKSRTRGMGVVLSAHAEEEFLVETESKQVTLRLHKRRGRWDGSDPQVRYCFEEIAAGDLPVDDDRAVLAQTLPAAKGRQDKSSIAARRA